MTRLHIFFTTLFTNNNIEVVMQIYAFLFDHKSITELQYERWKYIKKILYNVCNVWNTMLLVDIYLIKRCECTSDGDPSISRKWILIHISYISILIKHFCSYFYIYIFFSLKNVRGIFNEIWTRIRFHKRSLKQTLVNILLNIHLTFLWSKPNV